MPPGEAEKVAVESIEGRRRGGVDQLVPSLVVPELRQFESPVRVRRGEPLQRQLVVDRGWAGDPQHTQTRRVLVGLTGQFLNQSATLGEQIERVG